MPNVEDRVGRLERDIRRVRVAMLLLLVVAAGLLLAMLLPQGRAQAVAVFAATALLLAGAETAVYVWRRGQGVPDIVRAKKFEVVDDRGHIFVEIGETTDGRGAVVTHDGDTHVILTPAHPPVMERRERNHGAAELREAGAPTDAATTPDAAAAARDAQRDAARPGRTETSKTSGTVDVKLIYRGDGVYEAKITERNGTSEAGDEDHENG